MVASRSSGKIEAKSVVAAFVRKPDHRREHRENELWMGILTHGLDHFGVSEVVNDDLGHFWEMPPIPFLKEGESVGEGKVLSCMRHALTRMA